jgi:ribokinase
MRILVIGSINRDIVLTLPKVPEEGETVFSRSMTFHPGGKGANQAVACSRLGAYTTIVGCVGGDENGHYMLKTLRDNHIDTRFLLATGQPTGLAVVTVDECGNNRIIVHTGANRMVTANMVKTALQEHAWDAVLMQWEIPIETVLQAIEISAERGFFTVLDPAPAMPISGIRMPPGLTVLTPNEREAEILSGLPVRDMRQAELAARALSAHAKVILIKMGAKGALLYANGQAVHFTACPVTPVDTTGAGDAFTAAFAVRYAQNGDWTEAVRFAMAAGAVSTLKNGAQPAMPTSREIQEFVKQNVE